MDLIARRVGNAREVRSGCRAEPYPPTRAAPGCGPCLAVLFLPRPAYPGPPARGQGAEREELWRLANDNYNGYQVYQQRAGERIVPVVLLEPA